jgi:hypothetical protein
MMAHYAFLDNNNVVTEVITGVNEDIIQTDLDGTQVGGSSEAWEDFYGNFRGQTCKRTSYNSYGGKKLNTETLFYTEDGSFRKNFALVGGTYNESLDAFIPPKRFNSWVLNEDSCLWEPTTPYPLDGKDYTWSEEELSWKESPTELPE